MSQIVTKFITDNAVDDTKQRLRNNQPLRARNFANSGDVNVLKVDASNIVQLLTQTQIATAPTAANDIATKTYVDTSVSANITFNKQSITLSGTDITNQYVDLAHLIKTSSLDVVVSGIVQTEGTDYTLSTVGGVTRVTFAGDLATGGGAALVSGDIFNAKYAY